MLLRNLAKTDLPWLRQIATSLLSVKTMFFLQWYGEGSKDHYIVFPEIIEKNKE